MGIDRRLVAKGRNEPLQGLLEQARYHVKLAEQHAAVKKPGSARSILIQISIKTCLIAGFHCLGMH